ncbi:MAG: hypothetical protein R3D55_08500 [Chloroflexota bacterium]
MAKCLLDLVGYNTAVLHAAEKSPPQTKGLPRRHRQPTARVAGQTQPGD